MLARFAERGREAFVLGDGLLQLALGLEDLLLEGADPLGGVLEAAAQDDDLFLEALELALEVADLPLVLGQTPVVLGSHAITSWGAEMPGVGHYTGPHPGLRHIRRRGSYGTKNRPPAPSRALEPGSFRPSARSPCRICAGRWKPLLCVVKRTGWTRRPSAIDSVTMRQRRVNGETGQSCMRSVGRPGRRRDRSQEQVNGATSTKAGRVSADGR